MFVQNVVPKQIEFGNIFGFRLVHLLPSHLLVCNSNKGLPSTIVASMRVHAFIFEATESKEHGAA